MRSFLFPISLVIWWVVCGVGCKSDSAASTEDILRKQVGVYASSPSVELEGKIAMNFEKWDEEILRMREKGEVGNAESMCQKRDELMVQYTAARMAAGINRIKNTIQGMGDIFQKAGEQMGEVIRSNAPSRP